MVMETQKGKPKRATKGRIPQKKIKSSQDTNNVCQFLFKNGLSIYKVFCLFLTLYFGFNQFQKYLNNKDVSSIVTKEINKSPKDSYPAYSVCLQRKPGKLNVIQASGEEMFDGAYLKRAFNFNRIKKTLKCDSRKPVHELQKNNFSREACIYRAVLGGDAKFLKILSDQDVEKISDIDFDKAVIDTRNFLKTFYTYGTNGKTSLWKTIGKRPQLNYSNFPFYKSYQTHSQICYTRKDFKVGPKTSKDRISFDWIWINGNIDNGEKSNPKFNIIKLYVHQPGQFYREARQVLKVFTKGITRYTNVVNIELNQITKVRKRVDGEPPCSRDHAKLNDTQWMKDAVKLIQCVPPFWKRFYEAGNYSYTTCRTIEDFTRLSEFTRQKSQAQKNVSKVQTDPCDEMSFTTSITQEPHDFVNTVNTGQRVGTWSSSLIFNVKYPDDYYTEITNLREFGPESLGAGIGGYIGIFIGYSLMQIPIILMDTIKLVYVKIRAISNNIRTSKVEQGSFQNI